MSETLVWLKWALRVRHCLLATKGQSVIEEKGEGFENGKLFVGWSGVPSTSFTLQCHVSRLNKVDYKSVMHPASKIKLEDF